MYRWRLARHARVVHIKINAGPGRPPSGVVAVDGGPARHFDGWLGLLQLLADALDPQPPSGAAGGFGGDHAPGGEVDSGESVSDVG